MRRATDGPHGRAPAILAGDVAVRGHGGDAEFGGQAAHGDRVESLGVGDGEGCGFRTSWRWGPPGHPKMPDQPPSVQPVMVRNAE